MAIPGSPRLLDRGQTDGPWWQGLRLPEIKRGLFKPTRPVIGEPTPTDELKKWDGNPRGFLGWQREHTLALKGKS